MTGEKKLRFWSEPNKASCSYDFEHMKKCEYIKKNIKSKSGKSIVVFCVLTGVSCGGFSPSQLRVIIIFQHLINGHYFFASTLVHTIFLKSSTEKVANKKKFFLRGDIWEIRGGDTWGDNNE
uniref:Uncharacterized protein n=1 Tax=Rhizophagus irregularis (strain DAOM 181602 / DAOM 197198 / MUCL 43194) TaxID=747089 RepID=U9UT31_RHIID